MGLGDFVSGIFGSKNKFRASQHQIDQNAFEYGGRPGGADAAAKRYQQQAQQAQQRQGAQAQGAQGKYGLADQDRAMGQQARQGQSALAQAMQARATGQVPSIAGMQAAQDMSRAQASQASMAASARGGAAAALAQQNAANNVANAQGAISGQAQINAANERLQAEQAASGAFGAMRGGDLASQGQQANQAQFNAQLSQQNNQFNTSAQMQQRQMNDAMTMGMTQNEMGVRNAQLTAGMNRESLNSANANAAQGINAGVAGQNAQTNQANSMGLLQTAASVGGMAAMSDMRSKEDVRPAGPSPAPAPWLTDYMAERKMGIPDSREPEVVRSTWGAGPDREVVDRSAEAAMRVKDSNARDARAAGSAHLSGGMAVDGMSPGIRGSASDPMLRQDYDTAKLSAAKEVAGGEITDREAYDRDRADFRLQNAKKADKAGAAAAAGGGKGGSLSTALMKAGSSGQSYDTSFHAANTYTPPQLLAVSDERAKTPAQRAAYERGQQAAVRDLGDIDEAASREASRPVSMSDAIAAKQREGRRDPVAFRRDTPAEQAQTGRDHMMRQADAMQASMARSMAQGPSVGGQDVIELDQQPTHAPAPWLVDYMLQQRGGGDMRLAQNMVSDTRAKEKAFEAGQASGIADTVRRIEEADQLKTQNEDAKARGLAPAVHYLPPPPAPDLVKTRSPIEFQRDSGSPLVRPPAAVSFVEPDRPKSPYGPGGGAGDGATPARMTADYAKRREMLSDERTKRAAEPSTDTALAGAARAMQGYEYAYKPGMTPPEQRPGERNVGPMAQQMAADPVARNIVKKGPDGLLMLDTNKMVKTLGAISADQQRQNDEQDAKLSMLASRLRRKK